MRVWKNLVIMGFCDIIMAFWHTHNYVLIYFLHASKIVIVIVCVYIFFLFINPFSPRWRTTRSKLCDSFVVYSLCLSMCLRFCAKHSSLSMCLRLCETLFAFYTCMVNHYNTECDLHIFDNLKTIPHCNRILIHTTKIIIVKVCVYFFSV
jgi:hypothetical protein